LDTQHLLRETVLQIRYLVIERNRRVDDKYCHLISLLNFHGLLVNPSAVVCTNKVCLHSNLLGGGGGIRGAGVELVSLGTHKSCHCNTGDNTWYRISFFYHIFSLLYWCSTAVEVYTALNSLSRASNRQTTLNFPPGLQR
jgi:hypothetical protein